jgi:glycosyltransferase involved in cell wall biosynthesis
MLDLGVVVPTFNSASTLDWTLCALKNQRGCTLEILVVDSGSTDGTLEICRKWGVSSIYVPPGSMYRAINEGIRTMETDWVTYLNSDDFAYPRSYSRLLELGRSSGAALVYGHCDFTDEEGRFLFSWRAASPSRLPAMFRRGVLGFSQQCAIFQRSTFVDIGGFDERYRHVADFVFFSRVALSGRLLSLLPPPSVAAFRLHSEQLSFREAEVVISETNAHMSELDVQPLVRDRLSLLSWRLSNLPNYITRLKAGSR